MSMLSDELRKPEYANLSDAEAAKRINGKTVTVQTSVTISQLKQYAIFQGIWPKLKGGQSSQVDDIACLCTSVIDWIEDPRVQSIDIEMEQVKAMIGQLVSAQIVTQQQADEVLAMGVKTIPWTQSVGLPEVGIGLVINARKEINAE